MSIENVKKEKSQKGKAKSAKPPVLSYCVVESLSEAEVQLRIDKAFDILFSQIVNKPN